MSGIQAFTQATKPGIAGCCCGTPGYGGGIVGVLPSCFCTTVPATLTMTSADPKCNYRMFQSCSIAYGDTPACYASLFLPSKTYLSTASFPDIIAGGAEFQYLLTCTYNLFSLSRVYCSSPFGSPFRDGVLYSWVLGSGGGNVCPQKPNPAYAAWARCHQNPHNDCGPEPNPYIKIGEFHLDNGVAFPGSDPSCVVTIDE